MWVSIVMLVPQNGWLIVNGYKIPFSIMDHNKNALYMGIKFTMEMLIIILDNTNGGTPIAGWFSIMENHIYIDDLGVTLV